TLTLNRPEKKNAMGPTLMREIAYMLSYAHYAADVWMVVLQARGDVYCAGADLRVFAGLPEEPNDSTVPDTGQEVLLGEQLKGLHKPCIARIHAPMMAGAFLLVSGCTQVYVTPAATFSLTEVKRGIWPMQVMASLRPLLPQRTLLDLCMRGQVLSASQALQLGLITELCADEAELDARIAGLIAELKENSPGAIRAGLAAWQGLQHIPAEQEHAWLKQQLNTLLQTDEAKEGLAAFREKRKPDWARPAGGQ
ncbi:MAG: enoyl-CoA hydratase-related protein, partial [Sphingobacteriia bacterium]